jgi:hypothetical membrane protein
MPRLREGQWVVISMVGMALAGIFYGSPKRHVAIAWVMYPGYS